MDGRAALLDGLTESQRHAVCVDAAPLCILAGAGSGKTRVLTRRIAWRITTGEAEPAHVLALTFTRKAAGELRRRLVSLGVRDQVAAGTFHAVALAQLRRWWADRGMVAPALLDRKVGLIAQVLGAPTSGPRAGRSQAVGSPAGGSPAGGSPAVGPKLLGDLAGEIEWAKARLLSPQAYPEAATLAGRRPPLGLTDVAAVYHRYESEKARRGRLDFDDLLVACAQAIETDPAFAASQRWRFRHLFVDEFQDVNPAQERLLRAWLGDRRDLCVVGDPNQAIYGWNGADPTALTRLPDRFPGAAVVELDDNWRSSPQILAVATAVLHQGRGRRGRGTPSSLTAHRPDGPVPTVVAYDTDVAEARGVARRLRRAHRPGSPWSSLAVLVRTNAQLTLLEEALQAAQIPHWVADGGALLAQPAVKEALGALSRRPRPDLLLAVRDWTEAAQVGGVDPAAGSAGADEDRRGALLNLVRLAQEYQALDPDATAAGFRSFLAATLGADRGDQPGDAVSLTTFHRAKGLEWPVVLIAGLEQGLVPIGQATTPAAEAEERRLLYVALTRAENELHCSWAGRRRFGTRAVRRGPSPYLDAIEAARAGLLGRRPEAAVTELMAASRRSLRRPRESPGLALARGANPEALEALRAWRSATAKASGVPAYVILHDATLASVASALPGTPEELQALPGFGPVKTARYGPDLLQVLSPYRASA